MMNKRKLYLAVCLTLPIHANALVCTDATGAVLAKANLLVQAYNWIEEKSEWAASEAQKWAVAEWEQQKAQYLASSEISAVTSATSITGNAASEERYAASPSACGSFTRAKAYLDSFSSSCDSPLNQYLFDAQVSKLADCGLGGSGLNCGIAEDKRRNISEKISEAVSNQDGEKLLAMVNPASSLGLSATPADPNLEDETNIAVNLLIGTKDPVNIPRTVNGNILGGDAESDSQVTRWAENIALADISDSTISKVVTLYAPTIVGGEKKASQMAQLEDWVNYYNGEEFLKQLTNTNDKSNLPSDWYSRTPDAKHAYLASLDADEKVTSSEQAIRMIGEIMSFSLRLDFMSVESGLNNNTLNALILKQLAKKRG